MGASIYLCALFVVQLVFFTNGQQDMQFKSNTKCGFSRTDYIFNETLGRCYKFHSVPKTWDEAVSVCQAEESYLAVINSQAEADFLVQLAQQKNDYNAPGLFYKGHLHLGFRKRQGGDWETVNGVTLNATGFSIWGATQPSGDGDCGATVFTEGFVNKPGHLNDLPCHPLVDFICEHVTSLSDNDDGLYDY
ncbi:hypothetical protein O0L34_g5133 [Tuta absoluta]|nr:hypothetical protein O0L34_g5133 [Tuta absoluta]